MLVIALLSSLLISYFYLKNKKVSLFRILILLVSISLSALWGGRLFHLLIEDHNKTWSFENLFLRFDGLTFYGSLFGGFVALAISRQLLVKNRVSLLSLLDLAAVCTALSYFFMRVGCFLNGCCWGKLCLYPWSVRYTNPLAVTPYKFVPIHPVQLYDAFLGFSLFVFCLFLLLRKNTHSGQSFFAFLIIFSLGRFLTEFFRGDGFRGTNLLGTGLSTSQGLSLLLFFISGLVYFIYFKIKKTKDHL